jgi:hypothetical protein
MSKHHLEADAGLVEGTDRVELVVEAVPPEDLHVDVADCLLGRTKVRDTLLCRRVVECVGLVGGRTLLREVHTEVGDNRLEGSTRRGGRLSQVATAELRRRTRLLRANRQERGGEDDALNRRPEVGGREPILLLRPPHLPLGSRNKAQRGDT